MAAAAGWMFLCAITATPAAAEEAGGTRDRPRSAVLSPEDSFPLRIPASRRHTSIMTFPGNNLSKSLSMSNIAGPFDEIPIKGLRYLSQSTDSLNRTNQVTESMESLTDEEMMDAQLLGEFEENAKEFEADSWSLCVEQQYLQQQNKELVKRQDVINELMQTELHYMQTLCIMSEIYSKGLQKEVPLDQHTVERIFPVLDDLLDLHDQLLQRLFAREKESQLEAGGSEGNFIINRIGDILVSQFSESNGDCMKKVYGKFCSRHNEAINVYNDLMNKNKNFKNFIKKMRSSSTVRRLDIPDCILLVTQRITKYPVLIQRILLHTKETDEDYDDLNEAVRLVKEVIAAVDSKVNEHEKRRRLKEFHSRMDSKSIMMFKSGQLFTREDLLRRKLIHDGALQLKNTQGRLKDVQALLLSDVLVFLQEKGQKYVFAMLDQLSTVISLQKLIVREVANKECGFFLITEGTEKPQLMEILASSKEERNTWMQLIQTAVQSMDKDKDEGIPSETEDDNRQLESKAKEITDMLKQKDTEIISLLEEKVLLLREMWKGLSTSEEAYRQVEPFFRSACSQESIMKDALQEGKTEEVKLVVFVAGRMIGHSFLNGGPCLTGLSSAIIHVLFGGSEDMATISLSNCVDTDVRDVLALLEGTKDLSEEEKSKILSVTLPWDLPGVTMSNRWWLREKILLHAVLERTKQQVKQIRRGLKDAGIWEFFSSRPDAAEVLFPRACDAEITPKMILDNITWPREEYIDEDIISLEEYCSIMSFLRKFIDEGRQWRWMWEFAL